MNSTIGEFQFLRTLSHSHYLIKVQQAEAPQFARINSEEAGQLSFDLSNLQIQVQIVPNLGKRE